MSKNDLLSLDGQDLVLFLTVLEELSVTKAAEGLGVTQSSVSHTLDKLRKALSDPLFVRSGRGIAPTERALSLRDPSQEILDQLKGLNDNRIFDPTASKLSFTIAANDFTRALIFPDLVQSIFESSIDARFRFLPSGVPHVSLLRRDHCDFIISPFPPEGDDIFQVRLFSDQLKCFFDKDMRKAPKTKRELLSANYIDVVFDSNRSVMQTLLDGLNLSTVVEPRVTVPNFDALANFIAGTDMITIQIGRMAELSLSGLQFNDLPVRTSKFNIYLAWHRRNHNNPAHKWLREQIKASV